MTRPATSDELVLLRTPKKRLLLRAAIYPPETVYTARVNQTFSTKDKVLEVDYDTPSGTLASVKADMTMLVGSTAGGHDKGIVRLRKAPTSNKFYVGENSDVGWADNRFLTVLNDFDLWPKHITLSGTTPLMDGDISYSNQHSSLDPVPVMGSHRVLKKTSATVSTTFDASDSYCIDSSIASYSWSAPGSSSSSGMTTATPAISYNSIGWKVVTLTVTAANGKTAIGVRLIYVWSKANPPPSASFENVFCEMSTGGWEFTVTLYEDADLSLVRDRALVILFAESFYGDEQSEFGPVDGCENIKCVGRIAGESIDWNPEQGVVKFTVQGAHYWLNQMKGFPSGLKMVTGTPAAWTEMKNLTVRKALWHFLHWRSTATKVMDVFLPDDTRYQTEVASLGGKLWGQISEFTFLTILANVGVNRFGQLYCQIDPQMIPEDERGSIPVVMEITKADWNGTINIPRRIIDEVGLVDLSGVSVNANAVGKSFFSLSPGHVMKRYGDDDIVDHLSAFDTQAENNELAGLILGWRDNEYPQIDIPMSAHNPLIDCFPNQYVEITVEPEDTPRGIEYSGNLIPRYVGMVQGEGGYWYDEISFEAETFEQNSTNGDIPFDPDDISNPPPPDLPNLPDLPIIIPGSFEPSKDGGPPKMLIHDAGGGLFYSENFNESGANVKWAAINAGLELYPYQAINIFFVTPSGALYAAYTEAVDQSNYLSKNFFLAWAPSIGQTFEIITSEALIRPSPVTGQQWGLFCAAHNPLVSEQVAYVAGVVNVDKKIHVGSGSSFSTGATVDGADLRLAGLSYGQNAWLYTRLNAYTKIAAGGGSILGTGTPGIDALYIFAPFLGHVRASTTGITFHEKAGGGGYAIGQNNLATVTTVTDADFSGKGFACDPSGMFAMTTYGAGQRGRSSDGLATWNTIPNLPFGNWWWDYAGGEGAEMRWVAAGGTSIRYSPDGGDTWENKEGNISQLVPVPNIDGIKVVEY